MLFKVPCPSFLSLAIALCQLKVHRPSFFVLFDQGFIFLASHPLYRPRRLIFLSFHSSIPSLTHSFIPASGGSLWLSFTRPLSGTFNTLVCWTFFSLFSLSLSWLCFFSVQLGVLKMLRFRKKSFTHIHTHSHSHTHTHTQDRVRIG